MKSCLNDIRVGDKIRIKAKLFKDLNKSIGNIWLHENKEKWLTVTNLYDKQHVVLENWTGLHKSWIDRILKRN